MQRPVAILFDNFGPYHWARVQAATERIPVLPIELAEKSHEYEWNTRLISANRRLRTLIPASDRESAGDRVDVIRRRLRGVLDEEQPDAVAVPGWSSAAAVSAVEWCVGNQRPAILMSESTAEDAERNALKEGMKRQVVSLFSAALVGGKRHASYLRRLGMDAERIFTGYDVVDNGYFANGAKNARDQMSEIRGRYGLPEHYFLASARFMEKKNLPSLIRAYAEYRKSAEIRSQKSEVGDHRSVVSGQRSEVWSLILLGDGPLRSDLRHLISDLRLADFVRLPGFIQYDQLPACYGLAKAFIHASTTEQWGLVVNEAMASGLPVLVSERCGCAMDLVCEGRNGFLFDPFDVSDVSNAMMRITSLSDGERSAMGRAAFERVAAFSPSAFAEGLMSAVKISIQEGPKKPSPTLRALLRVLASRSVR